MEATSDSDISHRSRRAGGLTLKFTRTFSSNLFKHLATADGFAHHLSECDLFSPDMLKMKSRMLSSGVLGILWAEDAMHSRKTVGTSEGREKLAGVCGDPAVDRWKTCANVPGKARDALKSPQYVRLTEKNCGKTWVRQQIG